PMVMANIESMTFPRDNCAYDCSSGSSGAACDTTKATGSCRPGADDGGRFGDTGEWDIKTYLAINHGILPEDAIPAAIECFRCDGGIFPPIPTRNEVLKWELDTALAGPPGSTAEDLQNNHPQCGTPPTGTANRRFMPIVVTDCRNVEPGKTTIQVSKIIVVLLTEAISFGPENDNKNLYGEITEVSDGGGTGSIVEDLTIRIFKLAR
ncbi:MAG: hypothetical protein IH848_10170, partial [Acidobacteria bacterium]|nr:hypothetical protein [Acidobacteriota bacterium]